MSWWCIEGDASPFLDKLISYRWLYIPSYRLVNSHCGWSYARLWLLFIRNKLLQNPAFLPCVDKTAFAIFCKFIPKCFKYIAPIRCSKQFYQTNLKHYPKSGTCKNPCSGRSLDRYLTKNHKVFQMRDGVWRLVDPFMKPSWDIPRLNYQWLGESTSTIQLSSSEHPTIHQLYICYTSAKHQLYLLVGGDWNMAFIFHFIYGLSSGTHWTHIFQRGRYTTNQSINGIWCHIPIIFCINDTSLIISLYNI